MRVLTLVLAMALTAGCASQPAAPTAPGAAAVTTAAKPAAPAAADATAAAKVPAGYRAKVRDGETVYCKNVARIGSNFTTETCMSAAEVEEQARRAEFDRQQFRQNQAVCGNGVCGGS